MSDSIHAYAQNKMLNVRWFDLQEYGVQDNRTGDQVAIDFIQRAGLTFKVGEES